jgi:hypothetical protein
MSAASDARTEIAASLAAIAPQLEGLEDYERLNLGPDAQGEIEESLEQYNRRVKLLEAAKKALDELIADGHPELAAREISDVAYQDLRQNMATIVAALAQFRQETASALGLSHGEPEPKEG